MVIGSGSKTWSSGWNERHLQEWGALPKARFTLQQDMRQSDDVILNIFYLSSVYSLVEAIIISPIALPIEHTSHIAISL